MSWLNDAFAPVVSLERTVESHADTRYARQRGKTLLQLPIEVRNAINRVTCAFWIKMKYVAVGGGDAEVLVFKIAERASHQNRTGKQNERQSSLNNNQCHLWHRRPVSRGAVSSARYVRGLRMRRQPRRRQAEQNASQKRREEREAKSGKGRTRINGRV